MTKLGSIAGCAIVFVASLAFAQKASKPPLPCPTGATCKSNLGTGTGTFSSGNQGANGTPQLMRIPAQGKLALGRALDKAAARTMNPRTPDFVNSSNAASTKGW